MRQEIIDRLIDSSHKKHLGTLLKDDFLLETFNLICEEINLLFYKNKKINKNLKGRISIYLVFHTIPIVSLAKNSESVIKKEQLVIGGVINTLISLLWRFSDNIKDDNISSIDTNFLSILRLLNNYLNLKQINILDKILEEAEKSFLLDETLTPTISNLENRYKMFLVIPEQYFELSNSCLSNLKSYYNILTIAHDYLDIFSDLEKGNHTLPISLIVDEFGAVNININNLIELNKRIKSILQTEFRKIDKMNSELIYLAGEVINET